MKVVLRIVLLVLVFGSALQADGVISIVTKFGKTGGLYGDAGMNTVGDIVNGRQICEANNTNANDVPGCDMSSDSGYNNNGTDEVITDDYYTGDLIVRTNDLIEMIVAWNGTQVNNPITLTSTLPSFGGKNYLGWDSLPSSCKDGSSISADGLTLTCVRTNDMSISYSEDSPFHIKVKAHAPNGLETGPIGFTISSDGLDDKYDDTDGYGITVTAKPMWNIQKAHISTQEKQEVDGVTGYIVRYAYLLEADEVSGETDTTSAVLGNEALGKNFTLNFTDDVSQVSPHAKLIGCAVEGAGGSQPYPWFHSDEPERSVGSLEADLSVSCTQNGGDGSDITIDYTGIDASLEHVPTLYSNGGIIPKTRMPIASGIVDIFVPEDDVKNAGSVGNDSNELDTNNSLTSFDPVSISGQSNFGDQSESIKDNSVVVPLIYRGPGYTSGNYHKYFADDIDVSGPLPDTTNGFVSADGVLTPGKTFSAYLTFSNGGNKDFNQSVICDVMDTNLYDVVDLSVGSAVKILGNSTGLTPIIEYATGYSGAWPPPLDQDNSAAVIDECKDAGIVWHDTTTAATAGGDPITKVRVRFPDDAGLPGGTGISFTINLKARSKDLSNVIIPSGTDFVNYSALHDSVLYDSAVDNWKGASRVLNHYPTAATGGDFKADRAVLVRAKVRTMKDLSTTIVEPSDEVTVHIESTFTTDADNPEDSNVIVTEMLGEGLKYVVGSGSIGDPAFGTCADLEDLDPLKATCDDTINQILIWDLGNRTANDPLPDIEYNFIVSAATPAGEAHTYTIISAPTDTSHPNIRKANKNVSVNIPASLFITKEVNTPYRDVNQDPIVFTSYARNGSAVDLTDIDMIDILPFNGDGGRGRGKGFKFTVASTKVNIRRKLPTSYYGTLEFSRATGGHACAAGVTWYYTNREPNKVNISPTDASNQSGGSTEWCVGTETGPDASCGYTEVNVTAVRLTGPSVAADETCSLVLELTPHDNHKGDVYTNTTSAYAQGVTLPTLSNHVSAFVPTTLLGDFVWLDYDADGKQDANEPGASGFPVSLLDGTDDSELNNTVTDADGNYIFEELEADTPYKVQVTVPDYYTFTAQYAGSNTKIDNDANETSATTGVTGIKILNLNQQYRHLDIGLLSTLTISGKVYKKTDNTLMENTVVDLYIDENNDGILDENDTLIQSQDIVGDENYQFVNVFDGNYLVVVDENPGFSAEYALLTAEELNASVSGASVINKDFMYGKRPSSDDHSHAEIINIEGNVTLDDLSGIDDDGDIVKYIITSIPTAESGRLYLADGTPVTVGMELTPAQAQGLQFDPADGFIGNAVFHYTTEDDDGLKDTTPATFTIPVRGLHIAGHVFQDGNGDSNVNGTGIGSASGEQLYVSLLENNGTLIDSIPVNADGNYTFTVGISPNTTYHVVLTKNIDTTVAALPLNWNNADGEQPSNASNGTDGTVDGKLTVVVATSDMFDNDFGINHRPTADDKTEASQSNPGSDTQVDVPTLTGADDETAVGDLVFTIISLPTNATLYCNATEITAADLNKTCAADALSVDPESGDQTVIFTYTTTDAVGVVSAPATVRMPFTSLLISGTVFDDGDGDANVNGTAISTPSGTQLYATLLGANDAIVATTAIAANGTYSFSDDDGVMTNTDYAVVLATSANATVASLPTNWNNTGENINSAGNGNDGVVNGLSPVSVATANVIQVDFGINHKPVANDTNETIQLNPGNATTVQVPELNVSDTEDGTPTTITIKSVPTNATLYYNGAEVHVGDVISGYVPAQLRVDPIDGDQIVVFNYTTTDNASIESEEATVTMPFLGLGISGTIYDDGNANLNGAVDGTPVSSASTEQLYVSLIGTDGNVILSKEVNTTTGSYLFTGAEGVTNNTTYTIVLSTIQGVTGNPAPAATLPANWDHTGENINSAGLGDDGVADGNITVQLAGVGIPMVDFGINHHPIAADRTDPARPNPAGDTQYLVPALPITDTEDGTPATVTIKTLPDPTTGILYYDGQPVTVDQVITDYNASLMMVDPTEGNPIIVFTYTTTDAANVESPIATITMPFLGDMFVGDIVWFDSNGDGVQDADEVGVEGVAVKLFSEDGTLIGTTETNSSGEYRFKVQDPGNYYVEFGDGDTYFTQSCATGASTNNALAATCSEESDSDVTGTNFRTAPFALTYGQTDLSHDAGIAPTAHIGDYVWIDTDADGIQDEDEAAIPGTIIELYDTEGNPVEDIYGNHRIIAGPDGNYSFDVPEGNYTVKFTLPEGYDGYVFSDPDQGDDDSKDTDVRSNGFTLPITAVAGQQNLTLDAGVNCGCVDVVSDSGDALGTLSLLMMLLLTLSSGLLFVRREEA